MQGNWLSQWKEWLLPAYFYGTWPLRRLGRSVATLVGKHPIAIVFYHRVADESPTPWTISNREFERQVAWLARNFSVISLAEAQQRIDRRENPGPAVCITFDDGYADNCLQALPLLISRGIPFTYFVATDFILHDRPFPHDVARGVPLAPNSMEQLRRLADAGAEIGAHTRSHRDLGPITDEDVLRAEILGSRNDLEALLGEPIRYFAFPYGQRSNLNRAAIRLAQEAGLSGVCSAYGGYNFPGAGSFHLRRLHADPHFPRFKNWLTLDPRLLVARHTSAEQPPTDN
jgi:peptidoglycan/xylan/chitin deacetylase (PgdA/CDA1 family)